MRCQKVVEETWEILKLLGIDERRRRLLELGADLFTRFAYDELSMARIAREAGISKALLYHYFPSNEENTGRFQRSAHYFRFLGDIGQDFSGRFRLDVIKAGGMVGLMALAYAVGRFSWAWFSDQIGRKWSFAALFLIQAVVFGIFPLVARFPVFSALAIIAFLCHGGVVGVMPAFLADCFGPDHVGSLFGLTIVAQAVGGVLGPMLQALLRESTGTYTPALAATAALMILAATVSIGFRPLGLSGKRIERNSR